ncbi:helix-turn-helix transcriptional regulator [Streptomyces sp. NBC_01267]|uniref:helix-turn-helix domain-containing protein n=1 Tax=Streptomyces sp. NBC_01267 TaxID=2903805 RepID=UPI002E36AEDC|nr:helix-turn-helix transcriptional regulator [Streptomyces sp. NBC_01267]
MPPRSTPTARQKRLGAELRKMRLAAGMSTEYAAGLLDVPRTNIPNMESGRSGISAARVRTLAGNYGCPDQAFIDALAAMASERGKGWWVTYRGQLPCALLDIAELEWHAVALRIAVTIHLPGLLQTEAYARAVFGHVIPRLTDSDLDARLMHRMDRRQVLERPDPPTVDVIIHEAALRIEFGGTATIRAQLAHILELSERQHIVVRVIPFKEGGFPGAGQSVVYASASVPALDVVELDATHGPEFLDTDIQLAKYRAQLDALQTRALAPAESRTFISNLARQL